MPTSDQQPFWTSRPNIVGITLALIVVVLHLVVGIGSLWFVAAIGAWGAGVMLTPKPKPRELPAPEMIEDPGVLSTRLHNALVPLRRDDVPHPIRAKAESMAGALGWVLGRWVELDEATEQKMQYTTIIRDFLPGLISGYREVGNPFDPRAVDEVWKSLDLIETEATKTRTAIVDRNLMELESHTRALKLQFGQFDGG
ncbi:hypothetical protein [Corynebacterium doosanense]|uniref:Uncharacterized protein n=1 Tax=Corynebacterium doosanense CAU 212 = DSM 45436 TaxID=558173 RepID=A0A097IJJ8_9CORY|nr:hypothetical protein [Corynebacterium doosanense]AIT62278.1 hypothetical protein CDOO_06940 [Corynebacterium doosanense CAU 212 = DSM 45436]